MVNFQKEKEIFKAAKFRQKEKDLSMEEKSYNDWVNFHFDSDDNLPYPNRLTGEREITKIIKKISRIRVIDPKTLQRNQYLTTHEYWQACDSLGNISSWVYFAEDWQCYRDFKFITGREFIREKNKEQVIAKSIDPDNTKMVYELKYTPENALELWNKSQKSGVILQLIDKDHTGKNIITTPAHTFETFNIYDFDEAIRTAIGQQARLNPAMGQVQQTVSVPQMGATNPALANNVNNAEALLRQYLPSTNNNSNNTAKKTK